VPAYDFEVDLAALADAARGTAETVQLFKDQDVEDLVPSSGDLGSEVVAAAVETFRSRWELGMNNLVRDTEEISGRLGKVAANYADLDAAGHERLTAVAAQVRTVPAPRP
jgi:hypothetical protein